MKRRAFLGALAAVALAPFAPPVAVGTVSPQGLVFHPDAFSIAILPLTLAEQFSVDFEWESAKTFKKRWAREHQPAPGGFARYVAASAAAEGRAS